MGWALGMLVGASEGSRAHTVAAASPPASGLNILALLPPPCCRPGLSARQPLFGASAPSHSDQLQINIESGTLDLDDEIDQLRSSVGRLKQVGGAGEAWGHCQRA